MHDGAAMRVGERLGDLAQDPQRFVDGQLAVAHQAHAQGAALDVRHHVVQEPAALAGIDQAQDVGMLQARRDADLAVKPFGAHRRGDLGPQDLDRDPAPVPQVLGEEHRPHAAGAQLVLDPVAVAQRVLQLSLGLFQHPSRLARSSRERTIRTSAAKAGGRRRSPVSTLTAAGSLPKMPMFLRAESVDC